MKGSKRALLIFCLIFLSIGVLPVEAQKKSKKKYYSGSQLKGGGPKTTSFLSQQWWLGFIFGANLTDPQPGTRYSTFSPIVESGLSTDKTYESYNKIGFQAGISFTYSYRILSVSLQPNYRQQSFAYSNQYQWIDENDSENSVILNYYQEQNLDYIDFPLTISASFLSGKLKPFIEVGGFYSLLINANKEVSVDGVDRASGSPNPFTRGSLSIGATEQFTNNAGLVGGIGFNYDPGNIRITFDIQYRYGLSNVTNTENRYADSRLAGIGDVLDDLSLNNIAVNVGVLFPLRFLSKDFAATE